MSQQSKQAFLQLVASGKRETDKARIYKLILSNPQTIETIKVSLCKDKSSFSSRLNDLLDMGLIEEQNGGRLTVYLPVMDKDRQEELANNRWAKKYHDWYRQGTKHGYFEALEEEENEIYESGLS